jgi:hypothetical protein
MAVNMNVLGVLDWTRSGRVGGLILHGEARSRPVGAWNRELPQGFDFVPLSTLVIVSNWPEKKGDRKRGTDLFFSKVISI